jgi:hypothetical protein
LPSQNGRFFLDLISAVLDPVQIRLDPDHAMTRITAQLSLDQQFGDEVGIVLWHAPGS